METFQILLLIFLILFISIPIIGIVFFVKYVIKKSSSEQSIQLLDREKKELILKARSQRKNLIDWESKSIEKISNNLDYNFKKGFTRKFNGYIKTLNDERIISFRRIDRGASNATSRIIAVTSDFEIYYDHSGSETLIKYNGSYLGKIVNQTNLVDMDNKNIGSINRNQNSLSSYIVKIQGQEIAYVVKNTDRRNFVRNRLYDFPAVNPYEKDIVRKREVVYADLLKLLREPNENEYKWITSIVIYEVIFYGIDFAL
ncbi:hypothetical protein POV26_02580 [Aequorivita todarodis]|uniref:hypothetical protein n=1 Tax=Aequorivita todarodis TaxID=2036821 RepID=UPI002350DC67|nr:hypothetical protein [Aequorivita todarodis]MDC7999911.1 hypothetical protein [Aequorivita todarodis]